MSAATRDRGRKPKCDSEDWPHDVLHRAYCRVGFRHDDCTPAAQPVASESSEGWKARLMNYRSELISEGYTDEEVARLTEPIVAFFETQGAGWAGEPTPRPASRADGTWTGPLHEVAATTPASRANETTDLTALIERATRAKPFLSAPGTVPLDVLLAERDTIVLALRVLRALRHPACTERLAALAHERWSGWMRYLFTKGHVTESGSFEIEAASYQRWRRQHETDYTELPEAERESDRVEARRVLAVLGIATDDGGAR